MRNLSHWQFYLIALVGGACFAVIYRIPRRYFLHATLLATFAKLGVYAFPERVHFGFATFFVTFIMAAISHLFAKQSGKPAQAFLIPGVIFLVPGTSIYRGFSAAMTSDYGLASKNFLAALGITAGISFALLLANWIVPSRRTL